MAQPAWAMRTRAHETAESMQYGPKAGGMIGRGIINLGTCFVDLLVNIVNETKTGPPVVGTLVGVAKGAGCTTLRALSGAVDVTTFWVPGFNGFPVSDSYDNCLGAAQAQPAMMTPGGDSFGAGLAPESVWEEPKAASSGQTPPKSEKPRYSK
jgi:putative exosortase-associated protein (TIGR04073 family)